MVKRHKWWYIPLLCLLMAGCSYAPAGSAPRAVRILVVAKSYQSHFWQAVEAGAQSAAAEYGIQVDMYAPETEDDYETQIALVRRAMEEGYDALLLSACDHDRLAPIVEEVMDTGIPVIAIDSEVGVNRSILFIGTDNVQAGYTAGEMVAYFAGNEAEVGVISFEQFAANGRQRNQGFLDYLEEHPSMTLEDLRYADSNRESPYQNTVEMLEEYPGIDAIATFNEWTTLGVAQAIDELGLGEEIVVVAFDNNEESVQMLEKGVINALIVQNPFAMGYLGVEQALAQLAGRQLDEEIIYTETVAITAENMFTTQNQKLLFPFSN